MKPERFDIKVENIPGEIKDKTKLDCVEVGKAGC